ncbi:mediator of RNA polymerase II transcription subunit 9-like isoform X2 [Phoenix dactylifera]|uniref:Mediator of RNA polymerase II transcription subunit 9-like isoform X2 n=1 Tax=Phoenix dactylifera TaxID=42345 RepID=A0A8B9AD82_PHODC|nr:mediator of RNA polymerase II transcription subunit 9-like isoform X2 [Phoenix dactylifera]
MDHQYGGGSWMRVPSQNSMAQDPHPLQSQYQQPQQQQQQQHHHHPSLASNFHLLHLLERLADAIESGTRDQHFDALTVEGQKRKLEETMQQLNQRRDLIAKYKSSVEELVKSDNSR